MKKNGRTRLSYTATAILLVIFLVPLSPVIPVKGYAPEENQTLVALTFDDGFGCWTSNIMPALGRNGLTATGFINDPDFNPGFTWEDARALHAAGWEIGWHTAGHFSVSRAEPSLITSDFEMCRSLFIEHGLPAPVSFAYPWGEHDKKSMAIVSEYFQAARTIHQGVNSPVAIESNPYLLSSFKLKRGVACIEHIVNENIGQGVLLVLMGHVIGTDAQWSSPELTQEEFEDLAQFLSEKEAAGEIDVVTLSEGVQRLAGRDDNPYWSFKLESPFTSLETTYGILVPTRYIQLYDFLVQRELRHNFPSAVPSVTPFIFIFLITCIFGFIGFSAGRSIAGRFRKKRDRYA